MGGREDTYRDTEVRCIVLVLVKLEVKYEDVVGEGGEM